MQARSRRPGPPRSPRDHATGLGSYDAAMRAPTRLALLPLVLLLASPPAEAEEAPRPIGRVAVRDDGFVRVTAERLRALGAPSADAVEVRLRGRPVPTAAATPEGDLVFLAVDHATNHSAWGVYELWTRPASAGRPASPAAWSSGSRCRGRFARRVHDPDYVHGALAAGRPEVYDHPHAPTWFLGAVGPGQSVSTRPGSAGRRRGTAQTLEVVVVGDPHRGGALHARGASTTSGSPATRRPPAARSSAGWCPPRRSRPRARRWCSSDRSPPAPPAPPQDVSHDRGRAVDRRARAPGRRGPERSARTSPCSTCLRATTLALEADAPIHVAQVDLDGRALRAAFAARDVEVAQGAFIPDAVLYACGARGRVWASTERPDGRSRAHRRRWIPSARPATRGTSSSRCPRSASRRGGSRAHRTPAAACPPPSSPSRTCTRPTDTARRPRPRSARFLVALQRTRGRAARLRAARRRRHARPHGHAARGDDPGGDGAHDLQRRDARRPALRPAPGRKRRRRARPSVACRFATRRRWTRTSTA